MYMRKVGQNVDQYRDIPTRGWEDGWSRFVFGGVGASSNPLFWKVEGRKRVPIRGNIRGANQD